METKIITQNILRLPTKLKKIPGPNYINPKKSHAEFRSLKNFQKALSDITQNHVTPCHFVVVLIAHFVLTY